MPALVVAVGVIPVSLAVAVTAFLIAAAAHGQLSGSPDPAEIMEWAAGFASSPLGLLVIIGPGQLVYAMAAFVPAALSPLPWPERLGLVRGRLPLWGYPLVMLGTPAVGFLGYLLLQWVAEKPGDQLKFFGDVYTGTTGAAVVFMVIFLSVVPGFVEESLFRGYVLRRLQERWHPALAIAFTGVLFAAAHIDPLHALSVLPLGLWFGFVAWASGTIWPAILCHFFINFLGVLLAHLYGGMEIEQMGLGAPGVAMLLGGIAALVASIVVLARCRK